MTQRQFSPFRTIGPQLAPSSKNPVSMRAAAPPSCMALPSRPLARAQRRGGTHLAMLFVEQGKIPAWATPIPRRVRKRTKNPEARAAAADINDQSTAITDNTRRDPQACPIWPDGIWAKAYVM